QVISPQTWQTGLYSRPLASRSDAANRVLPREPSPALEPTAEPSAAEPPTAKAPVPLAPVPQAPLPGPSAADAPGTGKVPVGRRVATIAASAIVAIRRRRPGRRAASPPRSKG
ncbi:MAG: hypothetical protein WBF34_24680, partial [Streptosporangiaceae bacterium]